MTKHVIGRTINGAPGLWHDVHPRLGIAIPKRHPMFLFPRGMEAWINYLSKKFRFGMPKYQKGVLHPVGFWATAGGSSYTVVLNNHTFGYTSGGGGYSGVLFEPDGQMWATAPSPSSPVTEQNGEWIAEEPVSSIGDDYDIRQTVVTNNWSNQAFSDATWGNIGSTDRVWNLFKPFGVGTSSVTGDFDIRDSATQTTQDSCTITCSYTITSDARLKQDIELLSDYNGLRIYSWKWRVPSLEPTIGVIAQEVPHAVVRQGGILRVDYSKL